MKKKFKIIGVFEFEVGWNGELITASQPEFGEMFIEENEIKLRIGAVWYLIEEIFQIEKILVGHLEMEPWIKIDYYSKGKDKTVFIKSGVLGGIRNALGSDITYLMNILYDFIDRTKQ